MRVVNHRGKWAVEFRDPAGGRHRASTGLDAIPENYSAAERKAHDLAAQFKRPDSDRIKDIWVKYLADRIEVGRVDISRLEYAWKQLGPFWGERRSRDCTRDNCRLYVSRRRSAGCGDGTIRREMNALAAAVHWAEGKGAGVFELPPHPEPKDRWLTKEEFTRLRSAAVSPHVELFLNLAIATGARKSALLELTWLGIRWDQGHINLGKKHNGKNRSVVPMTKTIRAVLQTAFDHRPANCEYVIQYNGQRVLNIRKAFELTVKRAGLGPDVTPHVLRHSAAVWQVAEGVPMDMVAQYLGHTDARITRQVYGRFAPDHLQQAAAALEI